MLTAEKVGGDVHSCYAILNELVGPGDGQVKVEVRADVSRFQAEGGWFAAWLQTLRGDGNPYDGNPATGTEIDIAEYAPYEGEYQFDAQNGIDTRNSYHPAVHDVDGTGGYVQGGEDSNGFVDVGPLGVNLRSGFHTFTVEWNADCQVFAVDGEPVFKNTQGVSTAKVHRPILSIEMSNAGENGYTKWGFASGDFGDNLDSAPSAPAEAKVDYIRIFEKSKSDNICEIVDV